MNLTFATQALCAHHLANDYETMEPTVHLLPKEMDDEIARIEPDVVVMRVDGMTPEQEAFLQSWRG